MAVANNVLAPDNPGSKFLPGIVEAIATVKYQIEVEEDDAIIERDTLPRIHENSQELSLMQFQFIKTLGISRNTFNLHHRQLRAFCEDYRKHYHRQASQGLKRYYTPFQQWCHFLMVGIYKNAASKNKRMKNEKFVTFLQSENGKYLFSEEFYRHEKNRNRQRIRGES